MVKMNIYALHNELEMNKKKQIGMRLIRWIRELTPKTRWCMSKLAIQWFSNMNMSVF